jgi:hypothetical protein
MTNTNDTKPAQNLMTLNAAAREARQALLDHECREIYQRRADEVEACVKHYLEPYFATRELPPRLLGALRSQLSGAMVDAVWAVQRSNGNSQTTPDPASWRS